MGHSKCGEISKTTVFNKTMKLNWNFHPGQAGREEGKSKAKTLPQDKQGYFQ